MCCIFIRQIRASTVSLHLEYDWRHFSVNWANQKMSLHCKDLSHLCPWAHCLPGARGPQCSANLRGLVQACVVISNHTFYSTLIRGRLDVHIEAP